MKILFWAGTNIRMKWWEFFMLRLLFKFSKGFRIVGPRMNTY